MQKSAESRSANIKEAAHGFPQTHWLTQPSGPTYPRTNCGDECVIRDKHKAPRLEWARISSLVGGPENTSTRSWCENGKRK